MLEVAPLEIRKLKNLQVLDCVKRSRLCSETSQHHDTAYSICISRVREGDEVEKVLQIDVVLTPPLPVVLFGKMLLT